MSDTQTQAMFLSLIGMAGGLVPFLVAIVCSAVWWKRLAHPGFFLLMAILAACGLHGLLRAALSTVRTILYLAMPDLMADQGGLEGMVRQELAITVAAAVLTAIAGTLLLRAAMRLQQPAAA